MRGGFRPSKPVSLIMILVMIGFLVLLYKVNLVVTEMFEGMEGVSASFVGLFQFTLLLIAAFAIALLVYNVINLRRPDGLPVDVFHVQGRREGLGREDRLRELDALHRKGLIDEKEHRTRKQEILREI